MAKKIEFSEEQINKIVELYKNKNTPTEIGEIYNVSKATIKRLLSNLGVLNKHPRLTEDRKDKMCELYINGMHLYQIGKELKCNQNTVVNVLKERNIRIRTKSEIHKKYYVNGHYFDSIDDKRKAYYLGLISADGTVSKPPKHYFSISLQEQDGYILHSLLKDMDSNYPTHYIDYKNKNKNYQNQICIYITDIDLYNGLVSHGIVPNKSYTLEYPVGLPDEYFKYFLLGLIDGDGSVYIDTFNNTLRICLVGTEMLLNAIKNKIDSMINIKCYIGNTSKKDSITKYLRFTGTNAQKLLNWIYEDSELYLTRKFDKYNDYIKQKAS